MSADVSRTCPKCSREVERGFRFCDSCGTNLEAAGETAPGSGPGTTPPPPDPRPGPQAPAPPAGTRDTASARTADTPAREAPEGGGHPEQGTGRFGIAGKVRWTEPAAESSPSGQAGAAEPRSSGARESAQPAAGAPPTWSPAGEDSADGGPSVLAGAGRFVLHLVAAWLAGAAVVALAAVAATLATDGRVALLEIRGLPIFLAGVVAIVIFAFLQTSGDQRSRGWMAGSTVIGFLLLIGGVVVAFQPSVMADMQHRLDRTLGVFGDEDTRAAEDFLDNVDEWSAEILSYRTDVLGRYSTDLARVGEMEEEEAAGALVDVEERFRTDSAATEDTLAGLLTAMREHGGQAGYQPLREGLLGLADIYADQLEGVRLVNQGFGQREQAAIAAGDDLFKDAVQRAVAYVDTRLLDILARGPVDEAAFRTAVARLSV